MATRIKWLLTRLGERMPPSAVHSLNASINYLETGRWMRARGFNTAARVHQREQLFDAVGARIGSERVLYTEFGVFRGESMRYWSRLLSHSETNLHGFDSFEGLPENWNYQTPRGALSTDNQ